jgi:hypothetical protein
MKTHVVTYATHSEGNYDNLINNNYNIDVITLGWNTKWDGFDYKFKLLYDYIKNLPDDDIIISLDGFDVWINGNLRDAISRFKKMNINLLFSKDVYLFNDHKILSNIGYNIASKIFNICRNNEVANTGLYMGYVKYIKILLLESFNKKCKDDQKIINNLCEKYNFIHIDSNNTILENVSNNSEINNSKAIFVQKPGKITFNRYVVRGTKEYSQFFLKEVFLALLIILVLLLHNRKIIYIFIVIIVFILFFMYIDKSCIL